MFDEENKNVYDPNQASVNGSENELGNKPDLTRSTLTGGRVTDQQTYGNNVNSADGYGGGVYGGSPYSMGNGSDNKTADGLNDVNNAQNAANGNADSNTYAQNNGAQNSTSHVDPSVFMSGNNPYMKNEQREQTTYKPEGTNVNADYLKDMYSSGSKTSDGSGASKGLGIASMVLGILSITCCCVWPVSLMMAIVSLVLGILSQKGGKNGFALAGIITASFGLVFGIAMFVTSVFFDNEALKEFLEKLQDQLGSYGEFSGDEWPVQSGFPAVISAVKRLIGGLFGLL